MNATLEIPVTHSEPNRARRDSRKKILLVDGDAAIRQILLRLLTEEGYFVVTAANEVEAFKFTSVMTFDLVLLDSNTPAKDGWETFEQLYAENPLLAIILITARPNHLNPLMTFDVGTRLEKPLDFTKLFFTIHNLLEKPAEARPGQGRKHSAMSCSVAPAA